MQSDLINFVWNCRGKLIILLNGNRIFFFQLILIEWEILKKGDFSPWVRDEDLRLSDKTGLLNVSIFAPASTYKLYKWSLWTSTEKKLNAMQLIFYDLPLYICLLTIDIYTDAHFPAYLKESLKMQNLEDKNTVYQVKSIICESVHNLHNVWKCIHVLNKIRFRRRWLYYRY